MTHPHIIVERSGAVATLTISRPEEANRVDASMMAAMREALARLGADDVIRLLILRGSGDNFCGGRDPGPTRPKDLAGWQRAIGQIVETNQALASFPGITIALATGEVRGFGFGLAVQADITLAAEDAWFSFPEIKAGFPPSVVMSYLSRWTWPKKAFELVITGDEIGALEAQRLGLVNDVVPPQEMEEAGRIWVDRLLQLDAAALRACKAFFRETADLLPSTAAGAGVAFLAEFNAAR